MSLLTHSFFPRSMFDMDWSPADLVGPSSLDLFDAFDELDRMMSRNLIWLNEPETFKLPTTQRQQIAEKYRITLDCQGFNPNSIKTEVKDNKLVVSASEGKSSPTADYTLREFRKTYELPKNVEQSKLASFVTSNGQLVVEFPIKTAQRLDLQPNIVEREGKKLVEINTEIPENVDPNKITCTCKDRDVIIKADYKVPKEEGGKSRVHYYRRCTLPEHADLDNLKCVLENNKLSITSPMLPGVQPKKVPIEIKGEQETKQQQTQQPYQQWQQPHVQQTQVGQAQQQQTEWPQKEQQPEKKVSSDTCPTCRGPAQRTG